jgi:predicted nucleic acid-binding protein
VKWILDTNVVSEPISRRPNIQVIAWTQQHPLDDMSISVVTLAEIGDGIQSAPEARKQELTRWFDSQVMATFRDRVLPLSTEVLIDWIKLSRRLAAERMMRRASDLLIAATARAHKLILVTRNVRHFADTGVVVYDPWNDKTHHMEAP